MEIGLKWTGRSPTAEGRRIYRSDEPFDLASLPEPIATLDPSVETYVDPDVVGGGKYYYRTEVFKGANRALSGQLTADAIIRSGPGPQILADGDLEIGYYGTIDDIDFINGASLATFIGLTAGTPYVGAGQWFKFAYKGKTLFIPVQPLRYTVSWADVYRAGAVYGVDGPGDPGAAGAGVNQQRIITINGERFLIRLMTGLGPLGRFMVSSADTPTTNQYYYDTVGCDDSEWNDLMLRIINITPKPISLRNAPFFAGAKSIAAVLVNASLGATALVQELSPGSTLATVRGIYHPNYSTARPGYALSVAGTTAAQNFGYNGTNVQTQFGWRPVLEWLP